ncbi:MAG: hypothetical protein AAFR79_05100 [Pseudomonadota bacterium]
MTPGVGLMLIVGVIFGAMVYSFGTRARERSELKQKRLDYYRRVVTDLGNADSHYTEQTTKVAGVLEMDEIEARQTLEDAKFASRDMITYAPSEFHYLTPEESDRMLAFTLDAKACDATIEECQALAMAGSNSLPAMHADLMRRIEALGSEAHSLKIRLSPRTTDYFWSD